MNHRGRWALVQSGCRRGAGARAFPRCPDQDATMTPHRVFRLIPMIVLPILLLAADVGESQAKTRSPFTGLERSFKNLFSPPRRARRAKARHPADQAQPRRAKREDAARREQDARREDSARRRDSAKRQDSAKRDEAARRDRTKADDANVRRREAASGREAAGTRQPEEPRGRANGRTRKDAAAAPSLPVIAAVPQ